RVARDSLELRETNDGSAERRPAKSVASAGRPASAVSNAFDRYHYLFGRNHIGMDVTTKADQRFFGRKESLGIGGSARLSRASGGNVIGVMPGSADRRPNNSIVILPRSAQRIAAFASFGGKSQSNFPEVQPRFASTRAIPALEIL